MTGKTGDLVKIVASRTTTLRATAEPPNDEIIEVSAGEQAAAGPLVLKAAEPFTVLWDNRKWTGKPQDWERLEVEQASPDRND